MKALKDCKWVVNIRDAEEKPNFYWWIADSVEYQYTGLEDSHLYEMRGTAKTKKQAIKNWEKFAKLNQITNYKIEE